MTAKKKTIIIISISVFALGLVGGFFAISSVACSFSPGSGSKSFRHRQMPPFVREEIGSFILWRLDKGAKGLDLKDDQQQAYEQLRASLEESLQAGMQKRGELKQLAHDQLENDAFDVTVLTQSIMTHTDNLSAMVNNNLTLFNVFYATLDPDQQEMINAKIKEKIRQHHAYCESGERKF